MSTSRTDYVILGYELPKNFINNDNWDQYEPYIEGHAGVELRIVEDPMAGEFSYVGLVLAQGDKYEGFENTKLELDLGFQQYAENLVKINQDFEILWDHEKLPQLFVCTVWS